jgi:hypothetical protein
VLSFGSSVNSCPLLTEGETSDTLRARDNRVGARAKRIQTYRVYSASAASVGESLFPEKDIEDLDTPYYSDVVTS